MDEKRPTLATDEMRLAAAKLTAADLISCGLFEESEADGIATDIAKCGREFQDGYELAKRLEDRCYWSCDLVMAEELDNYSRHLRSQLDAAERAWAARVNPQPPLPAGARIVLKSIRGTEYGTIDRIYERGTGQYLVKIEGDPAAEGVTHSRRIVNFEDAVPATAEVRT